MYPKLTGLKLSPVAFLKGMPDSHSLISHELNTTTMPHRSDVQRVLLAPNPALLSAYTYADGTWDFNGLSRYMHYRKWIPTVTDDDDRLVNGKFEAVEPIHVGREHI